jgi:hypothetical protein
MSALDPLPDPYDSPDSPGDHAPDSVATPEGDNETAPDAAPEPVSPGLQHPAGYGHHEHE